MKKALAFAKKHPVYIATIHALGGIGIGILAASLLPGMRPVVWGIAFLVASLLGHLYIWVKE